MAKTGTTAWESVIADIAQQLLCQRTATAHHQEWASLSAALPASTPEAECEQVFARRLAETMVCLKIVGQTLASEPHVPLLWDWLCRTSRPPFRQLFQATSPFRNGRTLLSRSLATACDDHQLAALGDSLGFQEVASLATADRIVQSYESLLHRQNRRRRGKYGVYYTPRSVTSHIVRSTHRILQQDYGLTDGLADSQTWREWHQRQGSMPAMAATQGDSRFVSLLDPALGTGAFFVEVVRQVNDYLLGVWNAAGVPGESQMLRWQNFVEQDLLPHLHGWEIILPAAALAHLALACQLADTGFDFQTNQGTEISWRNSLAFPNSYEDRRFTVILGNPPYSARSQNTDDWITKLLHGRDREQPTHSYFEVAGEPLAERKVWLHDDYVKFLRLAQWLMERSEAGLVALITNRGFLDNVTFRGVRYQLMQSFNRIAIVDLHGGRKAHETTPTGESDENVFDIEQGVAISFLQRNQLAPSVGHLDLWGQRTHKEQCLGTCSLEDLDLQPLTPVAPDFEWIPSKGSVCHEYDMGIKLTDLMPIHTTAPVTARDGFVIAFTQRELVDRLEQFADLSIPDERIREQFFSTNRSRQYPPGDTRSWKLAAARRRMAEQTNLEQHVRACWYRPFDRRQIFWADWMIDWPRSQVMQYFDQPRLALVARRQMLQSQPCNFFWITDDITLDGIIRSDNRGSESIFPLHDPTDGASNFAAASELQGVPPETALHYLYGLFHLPAYRSRYAHQLRRAFPRVMLPRNPELFSLLAAAGEHLAQLHLLRRLSSSESCWEGAGDDHLEKGYPKYRQEKVFINGERWIAPVRPEVWEFRVGGHQVARKWLKDRRGRELQTTDREIYQALLAAVAETITWMRRIDQHVLEAGGMGDVFPAHTSGVCG